MLTTRSKHLASEFSEYNRRTRIFAPSSRNREKEVSSYRFQKPRARRKAADASADSSPNQMIWGFCLHRFASVRTKISETVSRRTLHSARSKLRSPPPPPHAFVLLAGRRFRTRVWVYSSMLALTDAALARLCIDATCVRRSRSANGSRTSAICPRGQTGKRFLPKRSFGSIHSTCQQTARWKRGIIPPLHE